MRVTPIFDVVCLLPKKSRIIGYSGSIVAARAQQAAHALAARFFPLAAHPIVINSKTSSRRLGEAHGAPEALLGQLPVVLFERHLELEFDHGSGVVQRIVSAASSLILALLVSDRRYVSLVPVCGVSVRARLAVALESVSTGGAVVERAGKFCVSTFRASFGFWNHMIRVPDFVAAGR